MAKQRRAVVVVIAMLLGFAIVLATDLPNHLRFERPDDSSTPGVGIRGLIVLPDDGRSPILEEIESAAESIDLMIYLLTDNLIIDSLIDAEQRGVEVRILIEQHPFGGYGDPEELAFKMKGAGAEVRWSSDSFTFTHAKTMIVDRSIVAILNFNLSRSSFEGNREFGVISTLPDDVEEFRAIFEADWKGKKLSVHGPLTVSPDESRDEITVLIDRADETIDIYAEVIRDRGILERLEDAEARGVSVRVILSPDDQPDADRIAADLMSDGVDIRYADDLYIHAKAIVVDGEIAFVGSQNLTQTSLDENREIGIIVAESDIVQRLARTFELDFNAAASVS